MRGTLVVLNTYEHHRNARDWSLVSAGLSTTEMLLKQLQPVQFVNETLSMRWLKNPRAEELEAALLDRRTRIVIGAFESGSGPRELGPPKDTDGHQFFDLPRLIDSYGTFC